MSREKLISRSMLQVYRGSFLSMKMHLLISSKLKSSWLQGEQMEMKKKIAAWTYHFGNFRSCLLRTKSLYSLHRPRLVLKYIGLKNLWTESTINWNSKGLKPMLINQIQSCLKRQTWMQMKNFMLLRNTSSASLSSIKRWRISESNWSRTNSLLFRKHSRF